MNFKPTHEERRYMRQVVKENDMWIKNAGEDHCALMRAISNSIHFTDVRHKEIQKMVVEYFINNLATQDYKYLKRKDKNSIQRFTSNPELEEFTNLNLEIVSILYQARFKLFFIQDDTLCCLQFFKKTHHSYGIFKFADNLYAAVFDKERP